MKVTCILVSHAKRKTCKEAIQSVLKQTHQDWQLVVMDSGVLSADGYFRDFCDQDRVVVCTTGETEALREYVAIHAWSINEVFRRYRADGDIICYLSDDDLYLPWAFELFSRTAEMREGQSAWYGSAVLMNGETPEAFLEADVITGLYSPHTLDCKADGCQLWHRKEVWEPWCEDKQEAHHDDGLFFKALEKKGHIWPVSVTVALKRRTPESCWNPS